ncbi:hypothetical protein HK104_003539 [Borealophlyctis nickersoniae]|nr:hypothetical protein HK104_003539 [Borealophlyctis nickersoniae]
MGRKSTSTKSGKSINPADAHRKLQRKRELKKNKEERKKVRLIALTQKDTTKLASELESLKEIGLSVDPREERDRGSARTKRLELEEKLRKIKEARETLGLPSKAGGTDRTKDVRVEMKWYHPTFNPHGPKKSDKDQDDSGDSDGSDSETGESGSESELEADNEAKEEDEAESKSTSELEDPASIPMPPGAPRFDEAQIYVTLDLPEVRSKAEPVPLAEPPRVPEGGAGRQQQGPPPPPFRPQYGYGQRPPPFGYPGHGPPPPYPGPPGPQGMPRPPGPAPFGYGPPRPMYPPPPFRPPYMGGPPHPPFGQPSPYGHMPPPPGPYMGPMDGPNTGGDVPMPNVEMGQFTPAAPAAPAAPVISAAPVVRDLQKELTHMLPPTLLRRKVAQPGKVAKPRAAAVGGPAAGRPAVNAAPDVDGGGTRTAARPATGVGAPKAASQTKAPAKSATDEYEDFMKQMEGLM